MGEVVSLKGVPIQPHFPGPAVLIKNNWCLFANCPAHCGSVAHAQVASMLLPLSSHSVGNSHKSICISCNPSQDYDSCVDAHAARTLLTLCVGIVCMCVCDDSVLPAQHQYRCPPRLASWLAQQLHHILCQTTIARQVPRKL